MRLRNITGARDIIASNEYVIQEPTEYKGRWKELFETEGELHIEVGMGKGRFLHEMARLHPEINYVGIEMYSSVLLRALQKMEADPLPNLKFLCIDGRISFKTDNRDLFDFAVEELEPAGWKAEVITYDLHADKVLCAGNVMTEYEEKFSSKGNPICKYVIYRQAY